MQIQLNFISRTARQNEGAKFTRTREKGGDEAGIPVPEISITLAVIQ